MRSNELGVLIRRKLRHLLLKFSNNLFLLLRQVRDRSPAGQPDNPGCSRLSHFRLRDRLNLLAVADGLNGLPPNAGDDWLRLLRLLKNKVSFFVRIYYFTMTCKNCQMIMETKKFLISRLKNTKKNKFEGIITTFVAK